MFQAAAFSFYKRMTNNECFTKTKLNLFMSWRQIGKWRYFSTLYLNVAYMYFAITTFFHILSVLFFINIWLYSCFNTVIYVFLLLGLRILIVRLLWLRFFPAFSSVVRQMPGYNSPSRGTARTLPKCLYCSQILCCTMYCLFCVVLCIACV
jgi:hypothetical protein